jgi:PTS system nitrogen regulatory IIA component
MTDMLKDIQVDMILPGMKASNSKHLLHMLAREAAEHLPYSAEELFTQLTIKEKKSSSAIGDGVAIANLQMNNLQRHFKMLVILKNPVEMESPDNRPVDIICLMISPKYEGPVHLRRLSRLSRFFQNRELCARIRETQDPDVIQSLLNAPDGWMLAA